MDVDEDPAMMSNAEARVAIPGEAIANSQDWMRCGRRLCKCSGCQLC